MKILILDKEGNILESDKKFRTVEEAEEYLKTLPLGFKICII